MPGAPTLALLVKVIARWHLHEPAVSVRDSTRHKQSNHSRGGQRGEVRLTLTLTCQCSHDILWRDILWRDILWRDTLWRDPYITDVTRFPPAETLP